jgi:hypothetical protein
MIFKCNRAGSNGVRLRAACWLHALRRLVPTAGQTPYLKFICHTNNPFTTPPIHAQNLRYLHHCKRLFELYMLTMGQAAAYERMTVRGADGRSDFSRCLANRRSDLRLEPVRDG